MARFKIDQSGGFEMPDYTVISADSHMIEPPNLWIERLDKKYRDSAPHVEESEKGSYFVAPGIQPSRVSLGFAAGRSGKELEDYFKKGSFAVARPSGWDPVERVKDQDVDGVAAEVLYTTFGMPLFRLPDADLQRACFKAYNDWVAEFRRHNPQRFYPIGLISLEDLGAGVKELGRCAEIGLKGAQIWGGAPADRPFWSEEYDPLWSVAQAARIPLSLHLGTAKAAGVADKIKPVNTNKRPPFMTRNYVNAIQEVQRSFTDIIFGGALERFPRLTLISSENDSGWLPHYLYRLDHAYDKFNEMSDEPLPMKPSVYVRRQVMVTFQDDPIGPMTSKVFGEDNYMWASDFPHSDSTWPHSRKLIDDAFDGLSEEVRNKIVCRNAAKVYGITLDA
jgi:predicted TIM-barrel fold metal-dependent hydrolase